MKALYSLITSVATLCATLVGVWAIFRDDYAQAAACWALACLLKLSEES